MLLAGEKLKKKMKCASGWGNINFFFFRKCASDWGKSKKGKNVKDGGNHVCAQGIDTQT